MLGLGWEAKWRGILISDELCILRFIPTIVIFLNDSRSVLNVNPCVKLHMWIKLSLVTFYGKEVFKAVQKHGVTSRGILKKSRGRKSGQRPSTGPFRCFARRNDEISNLFCSNWVCSEGWRSQHISCLETITSKIYLRKAGGERADQRTYFLSLFSTISHKLNKETYCYFCVIFK